MIKKTSTEADIPSNQYSEFVTKATEEYNSYLISRIREEKKRFPDRSISILDIGTGTGNLLLRLASDPLFSNDRLVGIDFSRDMIKVANQSLVANNLVGRIEFFLMDVHQMDLPDDSFDLIVGRSIIHHWANPIQAFSEIHRVLSQMGVIVINEPSSEPTTDALEYFNRQRAKIGCVPMVLSDKFSPKQIKRFLTEANLNRSEVRVGKALLSIGYEVCIQKTN